jgi:hypothetical protein
MSGHGKLAGILRRLTWGLDAGGPADAGIADGHTACESGDNETALAEFLLLTEQLYRAATILGGGPYHRG